MKKYLFSFFLLAFFLVTGHMVFAQTTSALQAEQVATKNYLASPSVTNKNILLSAMNTVNSQASAPGNTTSANAQSIEQAALSAYNGTPAPAATANSMNQSTEQQVVKSSTQTASVVAKGGSCAPTTTNGAELPCANGLECDNNGICNPIPSSGSVAAGGWCGSNDSACLGGLTCNDSGICVTTPATTQTTAAPTNTSGTGNFVPLTNLPVLSGLTTAPTFPAFFNALYKYAIGIAATLTVLQIIRAGIMYMGGDSVTETKQARALIASSVLGLVLVLSPVIIFSIINPKILSLQVGFSGLTPSQTAQNGSPAPAPAQTTACPSSITNGEVLNGIPNSCCGSVQGTAGWQLKQVGGSQNAQYECYQPGNSCTQYAAGSQTQLAGTNASSPQQICCNAQTSPTTCSVQGISMGKNGTIPYCVCK